MLDTDPSREIVRRAYRIAFDRQPDPEGLSFYSNAVRQGLTQKQLETILMNSDEYRERQRRLVVDTNKIFPYPIAYIQTIYINDFENALRNVKSFHSFNPDINCIIVVDDTIFDNLIEDLKDAGAIVRYSKWLDDLPRQRNFGLNVARQLGCKAVISGDPDEHYNELIIKHLRSIIQSALDQGFDLIQVNQKTLFDGKLLETTYFKDLIFELKHGVAFQGYGNLPVWHEGIFGLGKAIRLPEKYFYTHEKNRMDMLEHHVQGLFIVGGGANLGAENPTWVELRELCDEIGIHSWDEFKAYLVGEMMGLTMKEFMFKHRNDFEKDGDQNARALFQWYYEVLHPEQLTPEDKKKINAEPQIDFLTQKEKLIT